MILSLAGLGAEPLSVAGQGIKRRVPIFSLGFGFVLTQHNSALRTMSRADRRFISGGAQRAFSTTNKASEQRAMLRAQKAVPI
jgi:hypothetical protein